MTRRPRTQRESGEGTQGPHEDGRPLPSPTVLSRGGSTRRGAGRIGGAVAALVLFTLEWQQNQQNFVVTEVE